MLELDIQLIQISGIIGSWSAHLADRRFLCLFRNAYRADFTRIDNAEHNDS